MNRMKILALIMMISGSSLLFAETGLGAAFTYGFDNGDNNMGGVLTINSPGIPGTVQTLRFSFDGSDYVSFGISDDWWVIQRDLKGSVDYYIGLGFYAGFSLSDENNDFSLGGRFPLGVTVFPIDFLEFFLELTPAMGLGFEPQLYFPSWNVQAALGFRLWF